MKNLPVKDRHAYATLPIPDLYRWFAGEAEGTSPVWARLCRWIAGSAALCARLDTLPGRKRQPNLFLAALRYLDGPLVPGSALLEWVDARWPEVRSLILSRATQTNEPGRCAVLAPLFAALPQPVALLEVGASAGLCLLPDRYRYHYTGELAQEIRGSAAPAGAPVLTCDVAGTPPGSPDALRVGFRLGLDPNPLSAGDPGDARWLRALVWPGEDAREERLADALALAALDPPLVRVGTAQQGLVSLLEAAPPGCTPVLFHSAALAYLARPERDAFEASVREAGVRWVSFEGPTIVSSLRPRLGEDAAGRAHFVLALDGEPVARAGAHGGWVDWAAFG